MMDYLVETTKGFFPTKINHFHEIWRGAQFWGISIGMELDSIRVECDDWLKEWSLTRAA